MRISDSISSRITNDVDGKFGGNGLNSVEDSNVKNTTSDTTGKDITNEIELDGAVEIFSIEELVPSNAPMTIPYLELYRTNELEFIPYISPYNIGIQSTSDNEDSSSSDTNDESGTDTGTDSNSDTNGTGSSDGSSSGSSTS